MFTTDTAGQLIVLGHDGHALGMGGAQVGIFERTSRVSLRGLKKSGHRRSLETLIGLGVQSDLTDPT